MIVRIRSKSRISSKCSSDDGSVQKRKEAIRNIRKKFSMREPKSETIVIKQDMSVFRDFLSQDINGICMWNNSNDQLNAAEQAAEYAEEEKKELEPPESE